MGTVLWQILTEGLKGDTLSQRALAGTCRSAHAEAMRGLGATADISWYPAGACAVGATEEQRLADGIPWRFYKQRHHLTKLVASPLHDTDQGLFRTMSPITSMLKHLTSLDIEIIHSSSEMETLAATCPQLQHLRITIRRRRDIAFHTTRVPLSRLSRLRQMQTLSVFAPRPMAIEGFGCMARGMRNLASLEVNWCQVKDLGCMPALRHLVITLYPNPECIYTLADSVRYHGTLADGIVNVHVPKGWVARKHSRSHPAIHYVQDLLP